MKKNLYPHSIASCFVAILLMMTVCSFSSLAQSWTIYDGSVVPIETVPAFSTSSGSYVPAQNLIVDDPDITGNHLLRMAVPAPGEDPIIQTAFYWRMNFVSHSIPVTDMTVVMRVKGHTGRDMAMDIDIHYSDKRSRITLHTATSLARIRNGSGTDVTLGVDLTDWNIFRFVMNATETKMYVNEDPTPALVFVPATSASSNRHFRFGDGDSGNTFGADIDWIIWDVTGDYAPNQGLPIPAELLPPDPQPSNWTIYDGSIHPIDHQGIQFTRSNVAGATPEVFDTWSTIINDPDVPGNKLLQFVDNATGQRGMWRVNVPEEATKLTWVARLKAYEPLQMWTMDLDVEFNGTREQFFIINDNTLHVRRGVNTIYPFPEGYSVSDWNLYRFVFDSEASPKTVSVYLNEDPTPFVTATPLDVAGTNRYFRFGNGDNNRTAGYLMDWMIWDITGAFAPGEGSPLPDFSFTPSSDASLSALNVDGELIDGFDPEVVAYELVLPVGTTDVPVITATATDAGATLEITQADAIPGTAIVEVTAENGFTTKTYSVSIRLVSQDAKLASITVDGTPLVGFDPDVVAYTVYLPLETTTEIPVVGAVAADTDASVAITQATEMDGTATILVTAEDGQTELTYTLNFVLVSVDATLSDLKVDGTTISGFDPEITEYNYILPEGTIVPPVVTATVNNENANLDITQATEIPGAAIVEVTAQDGQTTLMYSVQFLTGSSDATLSDLLVDGTTVTGFDPQVIIYDIPLPVGTTDVPVVTAVANDENAEMLITQAIGIPGTATVQVTAEDNFTVIAYSVNFYPASSDASLQELHIEGRLWSTFDTEVFAYQVNVPPSYSIVPVVTGVATDQAASVAVTQATQVPGTATILVTAQDGATQATYTIAFDIAAYDWRYYDASVLPNEHIPTFSPSNVGGAGGTNVLVQDPEDTTNKFLELITAANADNYMWSTPLEPETPGFTIIMKVKAANDLARRVLELDVHHNGLRERMYINREFNRLRLNEGIGGGDTGEIPAPDGTNLSDWNIYRLTKEGNATKLYLNENPVPIAIGVTPTATTQQYFRFGDGNGSHNAAALIDWIVWDQTGAYAPGQGLYIPGKIMSPNWDAALAQLLVDGNPVVGFDPEVLEYDVVFDQAPGQVPVVAATPNFAEATVEITQAPEFPGTATVEVTAVNGFTVKTYTVTFRLMSSDATLESITVNDVALEGFDPAQTTYNVILPVGTVAIPVVDAQATDPSAQVSITQATALPGSASILVTAENQSTQTYTVNFTVDNTSVGNILEDQLKVFPNPVRNHMTIELGGLSGYANLEILNLAGQVLVSQRLNSNSETIDLSSLEKGNYIVRVYSGSANFTKIIVKQ